MFREGLRPPDPFRKGGPLEEAVTQDGMSLDAFCKLGPVLLLCLPTTTSWSGRRLLKTIAAERRAIESAGVRLVLVHAEPEPALERYELQYVARVHDPDGALAEHFGFEGKVRGAMLGSATLPDGSRLVKLVQ